MFRSYISRQIPLEKVLRPGSFQRAGWNSSVRGDSATIRKGQRIKYRLVHQIIPEKSIGIFRATSISYSCQINAILVVLLPYIRQGTFSKSYKISQLIHTYSIVN